MTRMIGKVALLSLMLGVSTIACTPGQQGTHVASVSREAAQGSRIASRAAEHARTAMARHQAGAAIEAAESAVAAMPGDSQYRVLLGQTYMSAGRFASAEVAFQDALTLTPNQPKVAFRLALAEIAEGHGRDAQALLRPLDGQVPVGDLGLALAMAGDRAGGIAKLIELVRSGKSDARGRQNLALAFALDGRWRECRAMAMQDTPPDRIEDRLAGWAALAKPQAGGPAQIAALLGVNPAQDPGMPVALALATPSPAAAPVALAAAEPFAPSPAAALLSHPNDLAPPAKAPVILAAQAVAPADPIVVPVATTPVLMRAASPESPVPLLRASHAPMRTALLLATEARPLRKGRFVVQLGAFRNAGAIQTAWGRAARLMPRLARYAPVHARVGDAANALVRLSVGGFETRDDAARLCSQIRAKGGQCFVREMAGDAPVQWVRIDGDRRVG